MNARNMIDTGTIDAARPESLAVDFQVVCDRCATGILRPTRIRTAFWQGDSLVVVQGIPAMVCPDCGEEYVADPTVVQLDQLRGRGFAGAGPVAQMIVPVIDFGDPG